MIGPATVYLLIACLAPANAGLPVGQLDPLPRPPAGGPPRSAERLVKVQASADAPQVHPGQSFNLAVTFTIDPGWHIYWVNPGDSGMPTQVDVTAPSGFTTAAVRFPRPMVIHGPDGLTYGYERQAVLFVPVTAPASLPAGTVTFQVNVTWLVCRKACLLGSVRRTISIATSDAPAPAPLAAPSSGEQTDVIDRFRARLPRPLEHLEGAAIELRDGHLVVSGPAGEHEEVSLYPIEVPGVTFDRPTVQVDGGRFQVTVPVEIRPDNALGQPMAIRGLLVLGRNLDDPCYDLQIPLDQSGKAAGR
jgi:DsbC/DsbD-like thiol-disulfide interchange protein